MTTSFSQLGLHPDLLRALSDSGYLETTPIQSQAIPTVLAGQDVMGAAQTGTGKTAAFSLPILHCLMKEANHSVSPARHPVRALILTPTRELAEQVCQSITHYASHTPLRVTVVYGGISIAPQTLALRKGVELLVATPGRLLDHIKGKSVNLSKVSFVVLDEADRMLDIGFLPDLQNILGFLPEKRQSLLFSATFSKEIRKLAQSYLRSPVSIEVAPANATASTVEQRVFEVTSRDKRDALLHVLRTHGRNQTLVFVNRRIEAARLARSLRNYDIKAEALHGDIAQTERLAALSRFKQGECETLVATDVAARGLDIKELPLVVNFDIPFNAEDYVHRIGRTGRAGSDGLAIALYTDEDRRALEDIEKLIKRKFDRETLHPRRPEHRQSQNDGSSRRRSPPQSKAPVDPWFLKPYEPSATAAQNSENAVLEFKPRIQKKSSTKVAALLVKPSS